MSKPIHALIIDDNSTDQRILAQILTLEGVTSTQIFDPADLTDCILELESVDIVFVDLELPHLNGYEVLKILREHFGETIPLIACTVHTSEVNTARDIGFDGFLGKPLKASQFSNDLHRILAGESVWEFK